MKKWLTKIVAIVACLTVAACCFTACNKDDGNKGFKGVYKIYSITISDGTNETVYNRGDVVAEMGNLELDGETMKIEIKDNGVVTSYAESGSADGTWVQDDQDSTKLVLTFTYGSQSEDTEVTVVNGTMSYAVNLGGNITATYVLKK